MVGIRIKNLQNNKIYEFPLFSFQKASKSWITWIKFSEKSITLVFDQLQNTFLTYDENGKFLHLYNLGEEINETFIVIDILPSTGLLVKYDPSINIIYFGFGLLMITTCLSYFPYTQFWIFENSKQIWMGTSTNRGKIQLEIEFENLIREIENKMTKSTFQKF